jgi:hypothetical protein
MAATPVSRLTLAGVERRVFLPQVPGGHREVPGGDLE